MALFNYATRELSAKIVYYGPGLSGKTTNIEKIHKLLRPEQKGRLISLPTEADRTLFFDFLPVELGQIKGFKVRFHLYTVPGQVFYNATRRLVLQGVDGVVFVADSQVDMANSNVESLKNLADNLATYGKKFSELPLVLQYNKRDLKNIQTVKQMDARLNPNGVPAFVASAIRGEGVTETLVAISRMVFAHLRKTLLPPGELAEEEAGGGAGARHAPKKAPSAELELMEELELEEITETPAPRKVAAKEAPTRAAAELLREEIEPEEIPEARAPKGVGPRKVAAKVVPPRDVAAKEATTPADAEFLREEIAPTGVAAKEVAPREVAAKETAMPAAAEMLREESPPGERLPERPAHGLIEIPPAEGVEGEFKISTPEAAGSASADARFEELEEIEIEIPEPAPRAEPAEVRRPAAAVSVETEGRGLTFLKFESIFVSPEGHAVLPAVFLDDDGNIVRLRIRIVLGEERG